MRLNTAIDFEATASDPLLHSANGLKWYELKVYVQDPGHENGFGTIKVYINDVNEAPNAPTFSGGVIGEYVGGEVARLSAIDPEGKAVTYGFAEDADANPANLFKITADGIISTVNPNGLDREASGPITTARAATYSISSKSSHGTRTERPPPSRMSRSSSTT